MCPDWCRVLGSRSEVKLAHSIMNDGRGSAPMPRLHITKLIMPQFISVEIVGKQACGAEGCNYHFAIRSRRRGAIRVLLLVDSICSKVMPDCRSWSSFNRSRQIRGLRLSFSIACVIDIFSFQTAGVELPRSGNATRQATLSVFVQVNGTLPPTTSAIYGS